MHPNLSCQNATVEGLVFRVLSKTKGLRGRFMDTCLARTLMKMHR